MSHIHEKIDFTAEVFIVHNNKVLLRMHDKYNKWFQVGGHIELDEDPIEAVHREAKEETGLDISIVGNQPAGSKEGRKMLIPPTFMNLHRINDTHQHMGMYYVATSDTDQINPAPTEKEVEFKWFAAEELSDSKYEVPSDVQYYALEALKLVK